MVGDKMAGGKTLHLQGITLYPPFILRIVFGLIVSKQGVNCKTLGDKMVRDKMVGGKTLGGKMLRYLIYVM